MLAPSPTLLSYASLALFLALTGFALLNQRRYWLVFPLVVLAIPNAINDLVPNQFMSSESDLWEPPAFSIFTHIDVFLLVGLVRYTKTKISTQALNSILLTLSVVFLATLMYFISAWEYGQLFGLFQLRYVFLTLLCFSLMRPFDYVPEFSKGLAIGMVLLGIEASIFTSINHLSEGLTSGNLGLNPLGHIVAACFVYFFLLRKTPAWQKTAIPILIFLAIILIFNRTRGSFLAVATSLFIVHSLRPNDWKTGSLVGTLLFVGFFLAFSFTTLGQSIWSGIGTAISDIFISDHETRTDESSSLITRFAAWRATLSLMADHLWFGVGPGGWASAKNEFIDSVRYIFLLDPHNDTLHFAVSYGVFFGLAFYYFLIVAHILKIRKFVNQTAPEEIRAAFGFILVIFLTGFSNSTLWKHQVLALTGFLSLYLYRHLKEKGRAVRLPQRSTRQEGQRLPHSPVP